MALAFWPTWRSPYSWKNRNSRIKHFLQIASFTFLLVVYAGYGQTVYEIGTFVSLPAGKHINHSYYSTWEVYFATEDGILIYNHQEGRWLDPITATDGLSQYPALLVWHDQSTRDIWIVTPDYVFIYDQLSAWMTRHPLPQEPEFQGSYSLRHWNEKVILSTDNDRLEQSFSAVFTKGTGVYDTWGPDSSLNIDWNEVEYLGPGNDWDAVGLPAQAIYNGQIDAGGTILIDGYPNQAGSAVSTIAHDESENEMFLGTHGMGVFHRKIRGGMFKALPFGLLSPDVMCLETWNDQLLVGGRAGLTRLEDYSPSYDVALRNLSYDYSFISAIDAQEGNVHIAARGGVYRNTSGSDWERLVKKEDLASKRIYSIASGDDELIMIGTERNAYLYHSSGLLIHTLFSGGLDWPVFDIEYDAGVFYLATYHGLYFFNAELMKFTDRVSSHAELTSAHSDAAIDPIYEISIKNTKLWASTHRGLIAIDLGSLTIEDILSPATPLKPRGLAVHGGRVWIGSELGLYSYNPRLAAWRTYTHSDGLVSDFITDIVAIGDYIWLGTNLGITRIKWKNLY